MLEKIVQGAKRAASKTVKTITTTLSTAALATVLTFGAYTPEVGADEGEKPLVLINDFLDQHGVVTYRTKIRDKLFYKLDDVFNVHINTGGTEKMSYLVTGEYWLDDDGDITIRSRFLHMDSKDESMQQVEGNLENFDNVIENLAGQIALDYINKDNASALARKMFLLGQPLNEGVGIDVGAAVLGSNSAVYQVGTSIVLDYLKRFTPRIGLKFGIGYLMFMTKMEAQGNVFHALDGRVLFVYSYPIEKDLMLSLGNGIATIFTNKYTNMKDAKLEVLPAYVGDLTLEKITGKGDESFIFGIRWIIPQSGNYMYKPSSDTVYPLDLKQVSVFFGGRG